MPSAAPAIALPCAMATVSRDPQDFGVASPPPVPPSSEPSSTVPSASTARIVAKIRCPSSLSAPSIVMGPTCNTTGPAGGSLEAKGPPPAPPPRPDMPLGWLDVVFTGLLLLLLGFPALPSGSCDRVPGASGTSTPSSMEASAANASCCCGPVSPAPHCRELWLAKVAESDWPWPLRADDGRLFKLNVMTQSRHGCKKTSPGNTAWPFFTGTSICVALAPEAPSALRLAPPSPKAQPSPTSSVWPAPSSASPTRGSPGSRPMPMGMPWELVATTLQAPDDSASANCPKLSSMDRATFPTGTPATP
mmetsp:Transcript_20074/g.34510  ORF Transcript_20074/g.34510 Transcript_20074/m.34510 type:complete len:305 (+) Transcript_20074:2271-3185(+)